MFLLRKLLWDMRWSVLGFGLVVAVVAAIDTALYPTMREVLKDVELPEAMGTAFGFDAVDYTNPRQFFTAEFFSWAPVLLAVFAIRAATSRLAGEEDQGTLEMLLAQPITRRRLYLESVGALAVALLLVCVIAALGFAIVWPFVDVGGGLGLDTMIGATALMFPLLMVVTAWTLLAGAVAPTKGKAMAASIGIVVVAYILLFVSQLQEDLEPLRYATPFYYAETFTALADGVEGWRLGVLLTSTALMLAGALWAFEARDIGTGRSPLAHAFGRG